MRGAGGRDGAVAPNPGAEPLHCRDFLQSRARGPHGQAGMAGVFAAGAQAQAAVNAAVAAMQAADPDNVADADG